MSGYNLNNKSTIVVENNSTSVFGGKKIDLKQDKKSLKQEKKLNKRAQKLKQKQLKWQIKQEQKQVKQNKKLNKDEQKIKTKKPIVKNYEQAKFSLNKKVRPMQDEVWLKLDNAALIYPSAQNNSWNSVFRESCYLKENIDERVLQKALELTVARFPHINVCLKRGFFWYYFQQIKKYPKVEKEQDYPCKTMETGSGKHLFRVLYYKNRISLETFHSLMDGSGSKIILCCLVGAYLSLKHKTLSVKNLEYNHLDKTNEEEIEDSFWRIADFKKSNSRKSPKCVQASGNTEKGRLNVVSGDVDMQQLKLQAKKYNATITEYLLAIYFKALFKTTITNGKAIVISVPVNLRNLFYSKTLRNFASYINIVFKQDMALEKMIEEIKQQMKVVNKDYMMANINSNVKAQKNWFVRLMPLFIKNIALRFSYNKFGEKQYTTVLSNVGKIDLPEEFSQYIEKFDFILGPAKFNKIDCACAGYNNNICISFSSSLKDRKIEREFLEI